MVGGRRTAGRYAARAGRAFFLPPASVHRLRAAARLTAPLLLALALCAGQIGRGFDSMSGMALSCLLNATAMLFVLWAMPPACRALAGMTPVLAMAILAIGWAAFATILHQGHWSDIATARLLSLCSGFFALILGALYARDQGEAGVFRLLDMLLFVTCLITVAGVAIMATDPTGLFDFWSVRVDNRFAGMIGNANVTAAIAAVFAVYAAARALSLTRHGLSHLTPTTFLFVGGALLQLLVLMMTASRFPQLVTALALAVMLGRLLLRKGRRRRRRLIGLALMLAVAMAGIWLVAGDMLAERLSQLSTDADYRTGFWRHVANAVAASPLTGFGLGSFAEVNAHFLTTPRMAERYWMVNSAHNIGLQLLVVGGWPYLLMLAAAGVLLARRVAQRFRRHWTARRLLLTLLPLMILACASVDLALDTPVTVTLFLLLAGLLLGLTLEGDEIRITDARG